MFKKIQSKVMALITIILMVAIVTVSFITYSQTKNIIVSSTEHEASNVVHEISRFTSQYLQQFSNQLLLFSEDNRVIEYIMELKEETTALNGRAVTDGFLSYTELNESIELVYIGTENKVMDVTPNVTLPDDFDPTSRPWYIAAKESPNEVIWTEPYVTQDESGEIVVTAAKAVLDPATNHVLGVIGFDITLNALTAIINQVEINHQGFAGLFDPAGTALVHPTHTGEDLSENETIQQMIQGGEHGYISSHFDGVDRFMYYSTIPETGWLINAVYDHDSMFAHLYDLRNKIALISLVLLALSLAIAYMVSSNITKPIKQLKTHVSKVASGDLTVKASLKAKDEVGQLTSDFNEMVSQMKSLIESVQQSANEVNDSAGSLSALSEETIASSEEVSSAVAEIASGSSKQVDDVDDTKNRTLALSNQIEKVTRETFEMEQISKSTKKVSVRGTEKVATLQEKTIEANRVLQNVEEVVSGLYSKVAEIEQVMGTINGISEQTNLLALNASIEAARAGEHGKGFAVVASEVRKLAEQSSNATVGVSETISGIITQSEKVRAELSKTNEIFQLQTEAVHDTQSSFAQVVSSIEEIVSSLSLIRTEVETMTTHKDMVVDSMQNIAAVAQEASASVEEVNAASDQQVDALTQVASSAEQLNQSSSKLMELIKQFKVKS
ncbi:methyl-accepting chemotaxis protein [Halalkalibacter okhensis]|uniref:Chemotaxis protein n=1 Tax=Halalkalibacter okhensis TaxID=333138 RepID=A0A0B0IFH7_9BACI|nr:methyl-accepting chemotaxis protein [Halalkalibacter okhensis]KHF40070.1 hypothetical protein LQ50_11135 [Halalkalibacter okhensis]